MNRIVVYQSETGFTRQYAEWIGAALGCKARPIKHISAQELKKYEGVIVGGWIMGNMIMGLEKIRKEIPCNYIVFAVGISPKSDVLIREIKEQNKLGDTPFFYLEGGLCQEQLGVVKRMMLKMVKKSVLKKENKTEQDLFMARALGTSFDHSDETFIQPLVDFALSE